MTQTPNIHVIPVGRPTGPIKWEMSLDGAAPKGQGNYSPIVLNPGGNAVMTFTIDHPGSIGFAAHDPNPPAGSPSDGIYIQSGTAKPSSGLDPQFSYQLQPDAQGHKDALLVLTDTNQTAGTYTYVLNFKGNTPQLDPIVQNGGCCGVATSKGTTTHALSLTSESLILYLAIAFILGAVAHWAYRRMAG